MQTFLPFQSFDKSARVLDRLRLGKQRVEAYQILRVLYGKSHGWRNHPAVLMWEGHERALAAYTFSMCREWIARGYKDTIMTKVSRMCRVPRDLRQEDVRTPSWLTPKFVRAHRSNLIRKNPDAYCPLWYEVPDDLPYVWPKRIEVTKQS